jgi:hypothetical protein
MSTSRSLATMLFEVVNRGIKIFNFKTKMAAAYVAVSRGCFHRIRRQLVPNSSMPVPPAGFNMAI